MANPYTEAAMSYVHRVRSSAGPVLPDRRRHHCLSPGSRSFLQRKPQETSSSRWSLELVLFIPLAIHIRDQFSYPQARLIPSFHRVHGVVAAAAMAVVAILLPMIFTLLAGWRSVGFIAVVVFLFGVVLWLVLLRLTWLSSIAMAHRQSECDPRLDGVDSLTSGNLSRRHSCS